MKKIIYSLMLLLVVTGCTAINEFNKKLEDFHKSLPVYSSGSSSTSGAKEIINLNVATRGLGKFENAKINIMPSISNGGDRRVILTGYYTNTSKNYQSIIRITADTYDKDGDRAGAIEFFASDIRPGEKINFEKFEKKNDNLDYLPIGHTINQKSWKFEID